MKKNKKAKWHLTITILIMLFIFVQSALPADLSSAESGFIVIFLADVIDADAELISFVVRKCAHFAEYFVLGVSLLLTVMIILRSTGMLLLRLVAWEWLMRERMNFIRSLLMAGAVSSGICSLTVLVLGWGFWLCCWLSEEGKGEETVETQKRTDRYERYGACQTVLP